MGFPQLGRFRLRALPSAHFWVRFVGIAALMIRLSPHNWAAALTCGPVVGGPIRTAGVGDPVSTVGTMSRTDGRAADELRPIRFHRGWQDNGEGSCLVEFGRTRVLCVASFTAGVPRWRRDSGQGWITAEYAMLPRSTDTRGARESIKGRPGGRTQEISRLIGRALRAAVDDALLGENTIQVDCDVLQADGGTRTAAITGAYLAVADACAWAQSEGLISQWPLRNSVAAVSVGVVDGEPRLDLHYDDDVNADTDMNVVMTGDGRFVEVQGTAEGEPFERSTLDALLALAQSGCAELTALQESALAADGKARGRLLDGGPATVAGGAQPGGRS